MITENQLKLREDISFEDLLERLYSQTPLTVKPIALNVDTEEIQCYISKGLYGYMKISDFDVIVKTSFSSFSNYTYYPAIARKIGKTIFACVSSITEENKIYLSRKNVIEKNYDKLRSRDIIPCEIISMDRKSLYLDCGGGVQGRVHISEATEAFAESLRDCEFKIGEIINCKIMDYDDETCRLSLSSKAACNVIYSEGDVVIAKIRKKFDKNEFSRESEEDFIIEILPTHKAGMLNAYVTDNLKYNDTVSCIITRVKPTTGEYKLELISKIT